MEESKMTDDEKYSEAKRQVTALKGFYVHLFVFICVMLGLLGINVATKSDWWVQWPLFGWGLGILGHAIGVFMPINRVGRDWEERKIKERLSKM
jgi:hypothetical protein